jgi:hypothetical protein
VDSNFRFREDESSIETPLGHKDHSWSFLHLDTITVTVADAPRPAGQEFSDEYSYARRDDNGWSRLS